MICRGCKKELVDGEEYRMVAEWPFCPSCFEDLLKGAGKPAEGQTAEQPASAPVRVHSGTATARCSVCKRQLGPEEGSKLGFWTFCPKCYEDLASLAEVETPETEGELKDAATYDSPGTPAIDETDGGIAEVTVGLAKYISCKGCGRRIPQGGSRAVDGESYCPDCYYAMSDKGEQRPASQVPPLPAPPADEADRPAEEPSQGGEDRCACCGHPLRSGFFDEMDGFTLCRACLSTDSALAVEIARERHRRLLDRIREGLASSKPL
ncbi:MAG: hypothetical protein AB9866_00820 [Syntrophobacteraceae bacterium]